MIYDLSTDDVWGNFVASEQLSDHQQEQFTTYLSLLIEWNERMNLTAIIKPSSIIRYHFQDSLVVRRFIEMENLRGIADVGSGAGFPGLALAILFPTIPVTLIEVNHKKNQFLAAVISALGLSLVTIVPYDWRSFLRVVDQPIDLFCARASLQPEELVRLFRPSSPYKTAQLVYWASMTYERPALLDSYYQRSESYSCGIKKRQLIFFRAGASAGSK